MQLEREVHMHKDGCVNGDRIRDDGSSVEQNNSVIRKITEISRSISEKKGKKNLHRKQSKPK